MHELPEDIQQLIYRRFFSKFVVPSIIDVGVEKLSPLSLWQASLQSALSRANMYTKGKLDISQLRSEDRHYVYSELKNRNLQIEVSYGKFYITTCADCFTVKYNEPEYKYLATINLYHNLGKYTIRFQNHSQDPQIYEETIAWIQ